MATAGDSQHTGAADPVASLINTPQGTNVANAQARINELAISVTNQIAGLRAEMATFRTDILAELQAIRLGTAGPQHNTGTTTETQRNNGDTTLGLGTARPGQNGDSNYLRQPAHVTNEKRLPNNTLNLHRYMTPSAAQTNQERAIQVIFPEAILQDNVAGLGKCEAKNRVVIPPHLQLIIADHTVLSKVREMQNRLIQALVPYELWPTRISTELTGDFQAVAQFIRRTKDATWADLLEAVIQVLKSHNALHSPIAPFVSLAANEQGLYL